MNKYRSRYEANIAKDLKSKGIKFEYETVNVRTVIVLKAYLFTRLTPLTS